MVRLKLPPLSTPTRTLTTTRPLLPPLAMPLWILLGDVPAPARRRVARVTAAQEGTIVLSAVALAVHPRPLVGLHTHPSSAPNPTNVLGVFGLSIRTTERDLDEEFGKHGRVEKVTIVYDQRSDRSRGFGFIKMATVEDAGRCIAELNGLDLNGRRIRVDYSVTDRPHAPTPGEYMGHRRPSNRDSYLGGGGRDSHRSDHRDRDRDRRPAGGHDRDRDRDPYAAATLPTTVVAAAATREALREEAVPVVAAAVPVLATMMTVAGEVRVSLA
ncbi:hypothetical protein OF83DRAFT_1173194 [Amylostereum chailletii]|nr:hypothetical protein OF83DRAFT_1173194 [Amylostereum chailletii]